MKTYVITLSKAFGVKHQQHGNPTNFRQLYEDGEKIHTIRASCELWENRFENILAGEAVLSLRQWSEIVCRKNLRPYGFVYVDVGQEKCILLEELSITTTKN